MRHRAHRHHRAHGQLPGAEVGPGRAAAQPVGEQGADVGQGQRDRRRPISGILSDLCELALGLGPLPLVGLGDVGEPGHPSAQRLQPVGERVLAGEVVEGDCQPVDQLRQPAGEVDVAAVDVVQRQRPVDPPQPVLGHRRPEQNAVEASAPGVLRDRGQVVRRAVFTVEPPPNARRRHPTPQAFQVVVGESEPPPNGRRRGEVEHLARRNAGIGEFEHRRNGGEQRVGLAQGAVGEADPEPVTGVAVLVGRGVVSKAERRGDQRRVVLDVRAHDQHVAWFEGGVLGKQADEHLAQHLDLPLGPVAGVYLQGSVGWIEERSRRRDRVRVILQGLLQPPEQGQWTLSERMVMVLDGLRSGGDPELQLAGVAAEARQQDVAGNVGRLVVTPIRDLARIGEGGDLLPQSGGGMREPQVDVAVLGERDDDVELRGCQPGGPEQRQPVRQVYQIRLGAQPLAGSGEALGRARQADPAADLPPQLRLPAQVVGHVGVVAVRPGPEHRRAMGTIGVVQGGEMAGGGQPPSGAMGERGVADAEMSRERRAPLLRRALVDGLEQRPDQPVGTPRIVVGLDTSGTSQGVGDQRRRVWEPHVGAHAVLLAGRRAEDVGQPLRDPPLDTPGRNRDDLGRERVARRLTKHLSEPVDQPVGALGPVDMQHVAPPVRTHGSPFAPRH